VFKVLGLFLLGLYIGRKRIYANLDRHIAMLKKIRYYGFLLGLPVSCLFAWNAVNGHLMGLIADSVVYTLSVVPLSLAYTSSVCLWFTNSETLNNDKHKNRRFFNMIAAPGRMALTNYIAQSVAGIIIFYGIGFGFALTGLIYVELIAVGVFILQVLYSNIWFRYFQYGPLEWIWRMLTYWKWLKIRK
jgi:uncharacterized protein